MKIGIFGGAFNPVHNGHLHLIDEMYRCVSSCEGEIDKLLIIPTANPPHKSSDGLVGANHRIAMLELAIKELEFAKNIEISTIELESKEKSYTYLTLKKLKKIYPNDSLILFIGSDQLFYFQKWYRYRDILKLAQVRAITREECERQKVSDFLLQNKDLEGVNVLVTKPVVVSSTDIRNRVANGESIDELVPLSVAQYIKENGLYE